MTKPFTEWTVLPHRSVQHVAENILSVAGDIHMPLADFPRTMTVVRLSDGRLVVYSAIALDESEMKDLESFGTPAFLIVPSVRHRLDVKIWKDRYPEMRVVAPRSAFDKVEELVHVDGINIAFRDDSVCVDTVPGTDGSEFALRVRTESGIVLVVNDLIGNLPHQSGVGGMMLRLMGFTSPKPIIPKLIEKRLIADKAAVRIQLEKWATLPLFKVIVSHGDPIELEPSRALRELAASL